MVAGERVDAVSWQGTAAKLWLVHQPQTVRIVPIALHWRTIGRQNAVRLQLDMLS